MEEIVDVSWVLGTGGDRCHTDLVQVSGERPAHAAPPSVFLVRLGRSPSPFGIHGDRVLRAIDDAEEARLAVFTVYDFRRGLALAQHVEGAYLHAFAAIDTIFSVYGKDGHGELRFLLRMKWIAGPSGGGRLAHSVRTFQAGWVRLRPRSCHP